jgi:hypothetical protein
VKPLSADDSVGSPHVKVGHRQVLFPNPVCLLRRGFFMSGCNLSLPACFTPSPRGRGAKCRRGTERLGLGGQSGGGIVRFQTILVMNQIPLLFRQPRALPWAVMLRPFGAKADKNPNRHVCLKNINFRHPRYSLCTVFFHKLVLSFFPSKTPPHGNVEKSLPRRR